MYVQRIVVTALVVLTGVSEAAIMRFRSPFSSALTRRQFGGGGFDRGGFDRGGFDGGDFGDGDFGDGGDDNGDDNSGDNGDDNGGDGGGDGGDTTLSGDAIQTASQDDGNDPPEDGQSASATDDANFINFCEGKDLTNGQQKQGGSCNGIPMGNIPASDKMVASVFTNPQNGANLPADQSFNIQVQMINFAPGTFTNADTTYYSAPQDLDGSGNIIGHTHVTVQDTGDNLNPTTPLDPTQFVFFKGINDAGNGQGLLSAEVDGGLPAGNYRLCSMASSANHQPVLMPVAQRGAQDDCVRFTVSDGGGGNNGDSGGGFGGGGFGNDSEFANNTGQNNAD